MSALDEISGLLDSMKFRKEEMAKFEDLLSEVSVALSDICAAMEKDDDVAEARNIANAIKEGLNGLVINAPDVHVTAPEINFTVPPAQVVVMCEKEDKPTGWTLLVKSRDGNGNIREISFKPEN